MYGPNTLGGSINLVKRRSGKPFEASPNTGMDSEFDGNDYQTELNFDTNRDLWYLQGDASYLDKQFWRLFDDFQPTANEDGGGLRENAGNTDYKGNIKLGLTTNAGYDGTVPPLLVPALLGKGERVFLIEGPIRPNNHQYSSRFLPHCTGQVLRIQWISCCFKDEDG